MKKQCVYWFLTINKGSECFEKLSELDFDLKNYMKGVQNADCEFYFIHHKFNTNDWHCHLYLHYETPQRFETIQRRFKGAHIEQSSKDRKRKAIRYLLHLDNKEKEQYDIECIESNVPMHIYEHYFVDNEFKPDNIIQIIESYVEKGIEPTIVDFVRDYGLEAIKSYYFVIKDFVLVYRTEKYRKKEGIKND